MSAYDQETVTRLQRNAREYIVNVVRYYDMTAKKLAEIAGCSGSTASFIVNRNPKRLAIPLNSLLRISQSLTHVSIHRMHYGSDKDVWLTKPMNLMAARMEGANLKLLAKKKREWETRFPSADYPQDSVTSSDLYRSRMQELADEEGTSLRHYCSLEKGQEMDENLTSTQIGNMMLPACRAWDKNQPYTPVFGLIYFMAKYSDQPLDYFLAPNYIETGCGLLFRPDGSDQWMPVKRKDSISVLSSYLNLNREGQLELFAAVCTEL